MLAVYGSNSSGNSNCYNALEGMFSAITFADQAMRGGYPLTPYDPFAWGPYADDATMYEVVFVTEGVRYHYGFVVNEGAYLEEWLLAWPGGRKQIWFERDGNKLTVGQQLRREFEHCEPLGRTNTLVLPLAHHWYEQLRPVYQWFYRAEFFKDGKCEGPPAHSHENPESRLARLMNERATGCDGEGDLRKFLRLLHIVDPGIIDYKLDTCAIRHEPLLLLKHRSTEAEAWLRLCEESASTRMFVELALPVVETLRSGGLLVIDELDAGLHLPIAAHIVDLFNRPETNPNNAQIVFTTHDPRLLGPVRGEPLLRRDQIWLTEKGHDGATSLRPLSDHEHDAFSSPGGDDRVPI